MALKNGNVVTYGTGSHDCYKEEEEPSWKFWKKRRHIVALLAFFGFFNIYALRVNLSIAIVAMTENKSHTLENGTVVWYPEFDWDSKLQGYILSSFFYGYITTQLIGGLLASKFGGKRLYGGGVGVTAVLTIITPWLSKTNVYLLLIVRICEGVFEGVTFPCIHAVWAKWAPPMERTALATTAFSGSYVGTVVSMPLCAYLANTFGWESIFYFFGTLGVIWTLIWWVVVADSPSQDPHISKSELEYIKESLSQVDYNDKTGPPWRKIITSLPVWAIVVSHFSENWGFYTLLTQLPKFLKDSLNFDLNRTGYMSGLPYLVMSITMQFSGKMADWFRVKGYLTTTQVRKIFNCGAFLAQTIFMFGAAFWLSPTSSMVCLTLAVGFGAFAWAGFSVNYLDVAPQYASVLMGLGNTIATLPGIFSPIISGYIVTTPTTEEWQIVFYITSAVYLFGCFFYGTFASGELQPWAMKKQSSTDNMKMEERKEAHDNKSFVPDA